MVQVAKLCCLTIITVPVLVVRSLSQDWDRFGVSWGGIF
jgi:hypothetical protein